MILIIIFLDERKPDWTGLYIQGSSEVHIEIHGNKGMILDCNYIYKSFFYNAM